MKLHLENHSLWFPGRGVALAPVSGTVAGLTLVVGRNGTGATSFLDGLRSIHPRGTSQRGTARWQGFNPITDRRGVPPRIVAALGADDLPDLPLARLTASLNSGAGESGGMVDEVLTSLAPGTRLKDLSREHRALLGLLWALSQTTVAQDVADVVVIDQVLSTLHPWHRRPAVEAVRAAVDRGTTVIWAEHLWHEALDAADHVLELTGDDGMVWPASEWVPRTVALPPHAAVARALGVERQHWFDDTALRGRTELADAVARPRATAVGVGALQPEPVQVSAQESRLGVDLDLMAHDVVALLATPTSERDLAVDTQRLTALRREKRSVRPVPELPGAASVGRLVQRWARRNGVVERLVWNWLDGFVQVDPLRRVDQHSRGEQALLLTGLLMHTGGVTQLPFPEEALDSEARRRLAAQMASREDGVVLCSRDVEFAARAATQVVAVGELESSAGPTASMVAQLPAPPVLVQAGSRAWRAMDVLGGVR